MSELDDNYKDNIIFTDEDGIKKDYFVKILRIESGWVHFENTSKKIISVPSERVFKVKRDKI